MKHIQPIIFEITSANQWHKPVSEDLVNYLLPKLQTVSNKLEFDYPKSQKLMEVISYEPSGNNTFCPLMSSHFFSGYFAYISSQQAMTEYKRHYKTAKSSYSFLTFCILVLEQRFNHTDTFTERKDIDQSDYPLWIWTTYNVLCYHCKLFKDYEMAITVCSLLQDFISGYLLKVCSYGYNLS